MPLGWSLMGLRFGLFMCPLILLYTFTCILLLILSMYVFSSLSCPSIAPPQTHTDTQRAVSIQRKFRLLSAIRTVASTYIKRSRKPGRELVDAGPRLPAHRSPFLPSESIVTRSWGRQERGREAFFWRQTEKFRIPRKTTQTKQKKTCDVFLCRFFGSFKLIFPFFVFSSQVFPLFSLSVFSSSFLFSPTTT